MKLNYMRGCKYMIKIEENKKYCFEIDKNASLKCFLNPFINSMGRRFRTAIIICPGGGYSEIEEREADPIGIRFMGYGFQTFVLRYSLKQMAWPNALLELAETVDFIREKADVWDIDPNRVVILGFSAGGHMAASLGTEWKNICDKWGYECRPNALGLMYPVISAGKWQHKESIDNLKQGTKCEYLSAIEKISYSIDQGDLSNFTSCFIVHNSDDASVSAMNSVLLLQKLIVNKADCEMHMFHLGGHGLSLGDNMTARIESDINERYSKWVELFLSWLDEVL